jgi:Lon protease (S16) C-terminal proteolytic domain
MKQLPAALAALCLAPALHAQKDPTKEAVAPAAAPAPAAPGGPALKGRQSTLYGLLVMEIGEGKLAGQASQMNCTAVQKGTGDAVLKFNQNVGSDMEGALNEVQKFMSVRHNGWPTGYSIEMSFEDRYQPKDGPSAAVACALMVDSLFTGQALDQATAVTGDMTATGSVQPVGGVPDKLRAAAEKKCTVVGIPLKNARSMSDYCLLKGPRPVTAIQVFTLDKFDEAKKLAATPRDPAVEKAIKEFAEIARVLNANQNPAGAVKHPKVIERLQSVLKSAPNHLSARILLEMGTGTGPKALSAAGSLEAINSEGEALINGIESGKVETLGKDKVAEAVGRLNNIRPRLDKRTHAYADALLDFGRAFRAYTTGSDTPQTRVTLIRAIEDINKKGARVKAEWDKLRSDQALMETVINQFK